ncbi:MAG: C45 family peptidase [Actinomycetes bacterium]
MTTPLIREVVASGDPQALGSAHGVQVGDLIGPSLGRWRDALTDSGHDADRLLTELNDRAGFRQAVQDHLPWLALEVEAIAEASGQDHREVFATNCLDEAWWWDSHGAGCSVVAVGGEQGRTAVAGQTMDLDTWMDGSQVVLRLAPDDAPELVLVSRAGMVGLMGANDSGLVVLVNTLEQLPVDPDGVPVAFVVRALLAERSLDAAVDVLHRLPHASGQSYTLTSREGVRGFECGAGVVVEYTNDQAQPGRRWHTNHPLAYRGPLDPVDDDADPTDWATTSSQPRLSHLTQTLEATPHPDGAALEALFSDSDAGICMYPGRWRADGFTFGSIVVELGDDVRVRIASGPPDRNPYVDVGFLGSATQAR